MSLIDANSYFDEYFNFPLKIEISDGRIVKGHLICTDCNANIVMKNCIEYPSPEESQYENLTRNIGLLMIPGKHITKVLLCKNEAKLPEFLCD